MHDPGIIDQDIDMTQFRNQLGYPTYVGQVKTLLYDSFRELERAIGKVAGYYGDLIAKLMKDSCRLQTDAFISSCNQNGFHHLSSISLKFKCTKRLRERG